VGAQNALGWPRDSSSSRVLLTSAEQPSQVNENYLLHPGDIKRLLINRKQLCQQPCLTLVAEPFVEL
jgi:hypothetical protein